MQAQRGLKRPAAAELDVARPFRKKWSDAEWAAWKKPKEEAAAAAAEAKKNGAGMVCYHCKQKGHKMSECPNRKK